MINSMSAHEARENPHSLHDQLASSLARNTELWNQLRECQRMIDERDAEIASLGEQRAALLEEVGNLRRLLGDVSFDLVAGRRQWQD